MTRSDERADDVFLQVMKIPRLDGNDGNESVLWDTACNGIFVRTKHAEMMNFPCETKRVRVSTLGGDEKEIDSKIYDCHIKDEEGRFYHFHRYIRHN